MAAKKTNGNSAKKTSTASKNSSSSAKRKRDEIEEIKDRGSSAQVKAIFLGALFVLFFFIAVLKGEDGNLWNSIHVFFFGFFGVPFFLVPFIFLYFCIVTAKEKEVAHKAVKVIFTVLITVFLSTIIYLLGSIRETNATLSYTQALSNTYLRSVFPPKETGAGLVGALLGYPLFKALGAAPSVIVVIIATLVSILLLTGITLVDIANVAKRQVKKVRDYNAERRERREERKEREEREQQSALQEEYTEDYRQDVSYDPGYTDRSQKVRIDIPIDNEKKRKTHKPVIDEADIHDQNIINIIREANKEITPDEDLEISDIADSISREKYSNRMAEGAKVADPQTVPVETENVDLEKETGEVEKQIKSRTYEKKSRYRYPPVRLLDKSLGDSGSDAYDEMQKNAKILIETLNAFNVKATITNINRGPSVTRYELQPAPGVKVAKFTSLSDDIALALAASGVRIEAPIPGKAAVGIEVPNKHTSLVSLRELIDSDEFKKSDSKLTCALGMDISGGLVFTDLSKLPHLLIAGTTGSGKSVCVNALLMSILFKASPDEVKIILIDPKMVEFSKYKSIPHLLIPVVSDAKKAAGALNWAVTEMLQRYKQFASLDVKDINSYNQLVEKNLRYIEENSVESVSDANAENDDDDEEKEEICLRVNGITVPKEKMHRVVIAIDELADLMMAAPAEVEDAICRLAQMARAAGMHLIIATQRPSVNVITGVIKANIPSRIALKVSSAIDSRTILDTGGAEKLIGRGDLLYMPVGANKATRVQCCFARDEEIEKVTEYIKKYSDSDYDEDVENQVRQITAEGIGNTKTADSGADSDAPQRDELIYKAAEIVVEAGQASTSLIQRRLRVGYARAGRIVDEMEEMGIVGPHQGAKARDVLITRQQLLEMFNNQDIYPEE